MKSQRDHRIAIARGIPNSFVHALSSHSTTGHDAVVSLSVARQQHAQYLKELRKLLPVISLPTLEEHPDCVFVEDTAVAIGSRAVICRLGHASRHGEGATIRLLMEQLGMEVIENDVVHCDGGDVLYTGRHLFVGISQRTTLEAAHALSSAFKDHTMIPVPVPPAVLHLKSVVTCLDESTLIVPEGFIGEQLVQAMQTNELGYQVIRLPNIVACNVVVVNGHVLAQDVDCLISKERIRNATEQRGLGLTFLDTSELAKKDGALTCSSILLSA